jgi:hypothetical protein
MRRHLSFANVAATLALVLAMSGGAYAAKHYLITSTKQIKPSVLAQLQGKQGPRGLAGTPGAAGTAGAKGDRGPQGPPGVYPTLLPSGQTETGVWGGGYTAPGSNEPYREGATFAIQLAAPIPVGHAIYVAGASAIHCPGRGQAEQGFLCIYQGFAENAEAPNDENIFDPETAAGTDEAAGARGFAIFLQSKKGGLTTITGSYAVTAP